MIQNQSKDFTLIVYNSPKSPKYFKINKKIIRSLIIVAPLLVIILVSLSFLYSMALKKQVNELKSKEPEIIADLKSRNEELLSSLDSVKKDNKLLTTKLSIGTTKETSTSSLGLFTVPIGISDLRDQQLLDIKNIEVTTKNNMIKFNFDLANNSPTNEKLSGYLSVVKYQGNLIQYYPDYELGVKDLRLEFSKGESFSFSRFRPTVTSFKKMSSQSARFKIYIFNRTGDLLAYRQVGPYNID